MHGIAGVRRLGSPSGASWDSSGIATGGRLTPPSVKGVQRRATPRWRASPPLGQSIFTMVGNDTVLKGDQAAVSFPAIESGSGPPGFVLGAPQVPFGNASSLAVVVIASSLWFDTSNVEDRLSAISNMEVGLY